MEIHKAIMGVMEDIGAIGKNQTNKQQGFKYRGIDDVMNALQPLMVKHKLYAVPNVLEQHREERTTTKGASLFYSILKVEYSFFAADGSSASAVVIGEGMDSGDKASNKAMAVAFKYACFQVFCIPTEEMPDPDAETPPPSTPAPPKDIHFKCETCGDVLAPYTGDDGKTVSIRRHAEGSKARFGKVYCLACIKELTNGNS